MLALFNAQSKLRSASASVICFLWIAGFVFCQTQCLVSSSFESCHAGQTAEHPTDHGKLPCHGSSTDSESSEATSCCCSVDVINPTLEKVEWVLPSTGFLMIQITHDWSFSPEPKNNLANYFHNTPWLEWAMTPELRLGPAIHSLAPPLTRIS